MADARPLVLLAQTAEDLPALSALMQDATLRTPDIALDSHAHRLVLLVNRYRRESRVPSRTRSALRIEATTRVQHQNWPNSEDAVLNLLSLSWDDPHLTLTFSDGIALRTTSEALDLILEDLGTAWETKRQPRHEI